MVELEKPNILLVDDRPENLLVLESILEEMDCHLFKATSGQEALRLVLKHDFDLALLDVQMPEMDGFELAQLMQSKEKTKNIQIIFITAISKEEQYIKKGYDVGAVNYLFKPIAPDELKRKVKVALQWGKYRKKMQAAEAKKQ